MTNRRSRTRCSHARRSGIRQTAAQASDLAAVVAEAHGELGRFGLSLPPDPAEAILEAIVLARAQVEHATKQMIGLPPFLDANMEWRDLMRAAMDRTVRFSAAAIQAGVASASPSDSDESTRRRNRQIMESMLAQFTEHDPGDPMIKQLIDDVLAEGSI